MAKIYGLNGVVTGRQGNNVFAVRGGEQVLRKYQPKVFNPNTEAQVAVRARMKLMSQLSAVMSSAIAIPRQGNISSRNRFTSLNFPATSYANGEADVTLTAIKLTVGVISLNPLVATRGEGGRIDVHVGGVSSQQPYADYNRVEYWGFLKQSDGTLRLGQYASSSTLEGGFPVSMVMGTSVEAVIYAYGVRFNTEASRVKYGNVNVVAADVMARLIASRVILESDVSTTETLAVTVPVAG